MEKVLIFSNIIYSHAYKSKDKINKDFSTIKKEPYVPEPTDIIITTPFYFVRDRRMDFHFGHLGCSLEGIDLFDYSVIVIDLKAYNVTSDDMFISENPSEETDGDTESTNWGRFVENILIWAGQKNVLVLLDGPDISKEISGKLKWYINPEEILPKLNISFEKLLTPLPKKRMTVNNPAIFNPPKIESYRVIQPATDALSEKIAVMKNGDDLVSCSIKYKNGYVVFLPHIISKDYIPKGLQGIIEHYLKKTKKGIKANKENEKPSILEVYISDSYGKTYLKFNEYTARVRPSEAKALKFIVEKVKESGYITQKELQDFLKTKENLHTTTSRLNTAFSKACKAKQKLIVRKKGKIYKLSLEPQNIKIT